MLDRSFGGSDGSSARCSINSRFIEGSLRSVRIESGAAFVSAVERWAHADAQRRVVLHRPPRQRVLHAFPFAQVCLQRPPGQRSRAFAFFSAVWLQRAPSQVKVQLAPARQVCAQRPPGQPTLHVDSASQTKAQRPSGQVSLQLSPARQTRAWAGALWTETSSAPSSRKTPLPSTTTFFPWPSRTTTFPFPSTMTCSPDARAVALQKRRAAVRSVVRMAEPRRNFGAGTGRGEVVRRSCGGLHTSARARGPVRPALVRKVPCPNVISARPEVSCALNGRRESW